jgi:hypothetical protein
MLPSLRNRQALEEAILFRYSRCYPHLSDKEIFDTGLSLTKLKLTQREQLSIPYIPIAKKVRDCFAYAAYGRHAKRLLDEESRRSGNVYSDEDFLFNFLRSLPSFKSDDKARIFTKNMLS